MLLTSLDELRWDAELRKIRFVAREQTPLGPCEICGSTRGLHRHHESYLRPLDTIALCASHHRLSHSRLKKRGRDPVEAYFAARREGVTCPVSMEPVWPPASFVRRWDRARGAT